MIAGTVISYLAFTVIPSTVDLSILFKRKLH